MSFKSDIDKKYCEIISKYHPIPLMGPGQAAWYLMKRVRCRPGAKERRKTCMIYTPCRTIDKYYCHTWRNVILLNFHMSKYYFNFSPLVKELFSEVLLPK